MSKQNRSRLMLIATLLMFAFTVVLMKRNEAGVFANNGRLTITQDKTDPGTVILSWNSGVDVPMLKRFHEAYEDWQYEADRFVIELNSPGGSLREGAAVIALIEDMKRTHRVDTRVKPRRKCLSMCVPIFLRGQTRTASANSRFMFHQPTAFDFFSGEKVEEPEFERRGTARRFFERYFERSEMDPEWAEKLRAEWVGKDVWYTGRELYDQRSNIVTHLE